MNETLMSEAVIGMDYSPSEDIWLKVTDIVVNEGWRTP